MKVIHHEIGRDALYKIWNTTEECMIIYIYTDGGNIVFRDEIYPIKKGTLCMIKKGKYHYTMPKNPSAYDRSKIFIEEERLGKIIDLMYQSRFHDLFSESSVVYSEIPENKQNEVEQIYSDAANANDTEEFVSLFLRLMLFLEKYTVKQLHKPNDSISKAIEFINQNYSDEISPMDISKEVHMSKYHFCRKFKSTVGITVMDYILKTRITAAKALLITESSPIGIISEKCGFSSVSYFCQIFKQCTGKTPGEFRKKKTE